MLRSLLSIIALTIFLNSQAQVTMTLQVPATGVMLKKQLWNMSLVYTGNTPISVKINITLSTSSNDEPVMTATTGNLVLTAGAKQVQAPDLAPIQYTYLSSAIADRDPDGFLSIGSYQACYTVIANNEAAAPLAEDCISFDVLALSPPLLNMPFDQDTIQTKTPLFTWLPPTPLNLFSNLSYQFNLVEVQPGQNPVDAVQQNIPLYTNHNCTDQFINYPSSGLPLDAAKQYAWQVIAQNNLQPLSQSEVWVFRIRDSNNLTQTFNGSYIIMDGKTESNTIYVISGEAIGIKFHSFNEGNGTVSLLGVGGYSLKVMTEHFINGDNYFKYKLSKAFKHGQRYYIVITNLNSNNYRASFTIK